MFGRLKILIKPLKLMKSMWEYPLAFQRSQHYYISYVNQTEKRIWKLNETKNYTNVPKFQVKSQCQNTFRVSRCTDLYHKPQEQNFLLICTIDLLKLTGAKFTKYIKVNQ